MLSFSWTLILLTRVEEGAMVEKLAGGSADPALRFARCLVLCMRVYVQCRGAAWTKHLSCPQSAPDDAWWGMAAVELRRLEWVKSPDLLLRSRPSLLLPTTSSSVSLKPHPIHFASVRFASEIDSPDLERQEHALNILKRSNSKP
jgi:hypothetical protein